MITEKEIAREQRLQKAFERLDSSDPACVVCNESNPHCLERHHIAGRKNADEIVIVCRNCHCKLSDNQRDHPRPDANQPTLAEVAGYFMLGLADLFELLVKKLAEFGHALIELARGDCASSAEVQP
jgi:hypothetical protein